MRKDFSRLLTFEATTVSGIRDNCMWIGIVIHYVVGMIGRGIRQTTSQLKEIFDACHE